MYYDIIETHTLGVSEVARILETSEETVRNHCRARRLHPKRLGPKKTRYFDPREVKQLALAIQADRAWKRHLYRIAPPVPRRAVVKELMVSGDGRLIERERELVLA